MSAQRSAIQLTPAMQLTPVDQVTPVVRLTLVEQVTPVHHLRPRCHSCRAVLAKDNPGPKCSPCGRRDLIASHTHVASFAVDRTELSECFDADGLAGIAERLDCSLVDAFEVALANGLVPASYRRRTATVRQLVECAHLPHIAAAERLGLSRWTVASYRKELRLHRAPRRTLPPAA